MVGIIYHLYMLKIIFGAMLLIMFRMFCLGILTVWKRNCASVVTAMQH